MREDVIKIISMHKDLTNVIILTFNIDFLFIENSTKAARWIKNLQSGECRVVFVQIN